MSDNKVDVQRKGVGELLTSLTCVIASGLATALLFPPFSLGGLVWVVLIPLIVVLWRVNTSRSARKGFFIGWLGGFAASLAQFYWVLEVSVLGYIVLSLILGIYTGIWGAFAATIGNPWRERNTASASESSIDRKIREKSQSKGKSSHWKESFRSLRYGFVLAGLWCGQEWLRSWVFTGFGWNSLGVAFHDTPVMAQGADILGVLGLSFIPVFFQVVLVQTLSRMWNEAREGGMRPHVDFGVSILLVVLVFTYGTWKLRVEGRGDSVRLNVLLVQLNIPQEAAQQLWAPQEIHFAYEEETLKALKSIEDQAVEALVNSDGEAVVDFRQPDWIMWPESALEGYVLRTDDGIWGTWQENMETLEVISQAGEFTYVMGLNEVEAQVTDNGMMVEKPNRKIWNSLVIFEPGGGLKTYKKNHLVIYGEYIPFVNEVPFLGWLYEKQVGRKYIGGFSRGEKFEPIGMQVEYADVGMIPSVCFEDTVPRLMRKFVRNGPQLILNVTNDGWFKETAAGEQHFANAKFRSIELRRPMIRCANTGVSAAVNSVGSTAHPDTGEPQELRDENGNSITRGWLQADVDIPLQTHSTLYALIGDSGILALAFMGLIVGIIKRKE